MALCRAVDEVVADRSDGVRQYLPVVMEPVPSYEDLIWLFEAEPVYRYADDEREIGYQFDWRELWPYTAVTFQTTRAGYDIEMYIEPGYQVVRLRLRTAPGGAELLDLDLRGVRGVGVDRIHGRELLRVDFPDDSPATALWLRMKPDVALHWSYGLPR
ncbi:hypothetical protein [Micromonospora sp. NPDC047074]|uniref:hypothetical protein n=1 Tax=Micromonospora sp. NPDC047074 TaxID=3154339 RepID=UPI0033D1868F